MVAWTRRPGATERLLIAATLAAFLVRPCCPFRPAAPPAQSTTRLWSELNANTGEGGKARRKEDVRKKIELLRQTGRSYEQLVPKSAKNGSTSLLATSGVGGNYKADTSAEEVKHKPKVATWGVFERPKDISKAFGGGRKVGVGGFESSPEEKQAKAKATKKALEEFRKMRSSSGASATSKGTWGTEGAEAAGDVDAEEAAAARIDEAVVTARLCVASGDYDAAAQAIEGVKSFITYATTRGGEAWIELAAVREAQGRRSEAEQIYTQLKKFSMDRTVVRRARALASGREAADFLKLNTEAVALKEQEAFNELRKTVLKVGRYNIERSFSPTASARLDIAQQEGDVKSLPEARAVLLLASSKRGIDLVTKSRVEAAVAHVLTEWSSKIQAEEDQTYDKLRCAGGVFRAAALEERDLVEAAADVQLRSLLEGNWTVGVISPLNRRTEAWDQAPNAAYDLNEISAKLSLRVAEERSGSARQSESGPWSFRMDAQWTPPLLFGFSGDPVFISGCMTGDEVSEGSRVATSWDSTAPIGRNPFGPTRVPTFFQSAGEGELRIAYIDNRLLVAVTVEEVLCLSRDDAIGQDQEEDDTSETVIRKNGMSSAEIWRKALGER
mmetsp:Transcript_17726/g.67397  ORF Transcript_17726/g.67397 Transcript_17726/m.67397 type:complete len:614 (-) Transcript_17726:152-1993(-)